MLVYQSVPPRFLRNILSAIAALSFAWARWAQKKSQAMVPMVPRLQRRVRRQQMVMQPIKFQGPVILARLFLHQNVELQYQSWPVTNILISLDFCIPNSKISEKKQPKITNLENTSWNLSTFFLSHLAFHRRNSKLKLKRLLWRQRRKVSSGSGRRNRWCGAVGVGGSFLSGEYWKKTRKNETYYGFIAPKIWGIFLWLVHIVQNGLASTKNSFFLSLIWPEIRYVYENWVWENKYTREGRICANMSGKKTKSTQLCRIPKWQRCYKVGPLPDITGVKTRISRVVRTVAHL